jgi:hypothetical protein
MPCARPAGHWLRAAARCETPPCVWPDRLLELYLADQYGARSECP